MNIGPIRPPIHRPTPPRYTTPAMTRHALPTVLMLLWGLGLTPGLGCASRPADSAPADPPMVAAADYEAALDATADVLRDRGFVVDRRDHRFGVVSTEPLGAATMFEVWKPNNVTADAAVRSTLNDQRRTVTVTLTPAWDRARPDQAQADAEQADATQAPPYLLSVEVLIEQRQTVTRRVGGAPGSRAFSYLTAAPLELRRRGIEDEFWRPLGRDPALEQRLAEQITQRLDS